MLSGQMFKEASNQGMSNSQEPSSMGKDLSNQVLIVDDDMFNLQILNDLIRIQLQVQAT